MMGVVNQFFSGFVLVKIPFPLTPSFKAMLQRGIPLASLDVTYVTSLSWCARGRARAPRPACAALSLHCRAPAPATGLVVRYFIVMFGMQGLFRLVIGGTDAEDEAAMMMSAGMMPGMAPGQPMPGQPVDNKKNFEVEKENLSLVQHAWLLEQAEDLLLAGGKLAGTGREARAAGKPKHA